jgi:hypothetical protein
MILTGRGYLMRTILIAVVIGFLIVGGAGPAVASGFLDEMIFSSEWWARDEQRGEIGVFTLGTYGLEDLGTSYHFSLRQATEQGVVFAVNGSLGLDQLVVLNATSKYGTPDLYYGFGGMLWLADEQFLFLPRINLGGKFGPNLIKLVLDVDFYSLLIVNAGKLEMGTEFAPLTNLRLYGGLLRMFTGTLVTSKVLPGTIYQVAARYETKPFYFGGEVYFAGEEGPVVLGEAGMNFSFLSLFARAVVLAQSTAEFGVYTIGARLDY